MSVSAADPLWMELPWRPGVGWMLGQAAQASADAMRLLYRAALLAEAAGVDVTSDELHDLLIGSVELTEHMLDLADGYGHVQAALAWAAREAATESAAA